MKKTKDLKIPLPEAAIIIQDGSFRIKPVLSVNMANIEDVHAVYDKNKTQSFKKAKTYCFKDMTDKQVMAEILQIEAQLWYESSVASYFYKDPNRKLEAIGLHIAMASRAKELADIYASIYESRENKEKITSLIFEEYVIFNYEMALAALKRILSIDISDKPLEEKELIGRLILYVHGNLLSSSIVHKDPRWIVRAKNSGKDIDQLLVSKGLGYLIDSESSKEAIKHDSYLPQFVGAVKNTIGSLLGGFGAKKDVGHNSDSLSSLSSSPKTKNGPHME